VSEEAAAAEFLDEQPVAVKDIRTASIMDMSWFSITRPPILKHK
jgi:hypothetical protein